MLKITDCNIYNTGGGCMVLFLTLDNEGELNQIGLNEECIVGYSGRMRMITWAKAYGIQRVGKS